jgi:uncharacterized protein (DUF2147 family)
MKKVFYVLFILLASSLFISTYVKAQAEQMIGVWKTIDDETGEAKSHVKIFKATNGMYYGKVIKLLKEPADKKCTKCTGSLKDQPIVGMLVITKMKIDGKELNDGKIMDPANGKYYYCTLTLDEKDKNKLNVRGSLDSWGIAGRNQTWYRVAE